MNSHLDDDGDLKKLREAFIGRLENRAEEIKSQERSQITGGKPGEPVLARWDNNGFGVIQRPVDEQGICRISIGGGDGLPVEVNYLVFRGDRADCARLLRRALLALNSPPDGVL